MRTNSLIYQLFVAVLALASCQPPAEGGGSGHKGNDANKHLQEQDFEKLVENFEDSSRDDWQRPDEVVKLLGDLSSKTVADIGAGSGYFSFRLAKRADTLIAIDIDKRFLDYITKKNKEDFGDSLNIVTRLSGADNPGLKPKEVDIVLVVNTYHHIDARTEYFREVWKGLKPGGKLVIVDYKKGELPTGPPDRLKLPLSQIQEEIKSAGFSAISTDPIRLPYQHVLVAQK